MTVAYFVVNQKKENKMTKEERKNTNKQEALRRKILHRQKRNEKYKRKIAYASDYGCPLHAVTKYGVTGSWADENSPTGYSQKCSYKGICQSPCNGDC